MNLPNDPVMLLSVVNTRLRDIYPSLEALCEAEEADQKALTEKLGAIGYLYHKERNQFV